MNVFLILILPAIILASILTSQASAEDNNIHSFKTTTFEIKTLEPKRQIKMLALLSQNLQRNAPCPISLERLKLIKFSYYDFDKIEHHDGEIVVLDAVAKSVLSIFKELHAIKFPIAKARPIEYYNGNDIDSMLDNNTSGFNCREIIGGGLPSLHAYGLAIDINPLQNPYVKIKKGKIDQNLVQPKNASEYLNRKILKPGMVEKIVSIFRKNGFTEWGGQWKTLKDWQHFQTPRKLALILVKLPPSDAEKYFEKYIKLAINPN